MQINQSNGKQELLKPVRKLAPNGATPVAGQTCANCSGNDISDKKHFKILLWVISILKVILFWNPTHKNNKPAVAVRETASADLVIRRCKLQRMQCEPCS